MRLMICCGVAGGDVAEHLGGLACASISSRMSAALPGSCWVMRSRWTSGSDGLERLGRRLDGQRVEHGLPLPDAELLDDVGQFRRRHVGQPIGLAR